eukprot:gb/GECG01007618.1/.p1 GENE.gb/GECG01007618.1/~~gb/GECG01007618.1/.p1  ORF type:complete len:161 (+),score=30.54 gb/GECG01007618.1/:1-483(+)
MDQQQSTSNIGGSAVAAGIHFEEEDVAHGVASMGDNFGRPQEDASQLQFGEGFDENCAFLSNSEVSWLLEQFQEKGDDKRFSDAFQQSLEYCRRFGGNAEMRTADSTDELRKYVWSVGSCVPACALLHRVYVAARCNRLSSEERITREGRKGRKVCIPMR